jgi:uncharacterized protein with HEPN domain
MDKRVLRRLRDIEEYLQGSMKVIEGMTLEQLQASRLHSRALERELEIVGEAVRNIPIEVQEMAPDIPWRRMGSLRNVLAHGYAGIDFAMIYYIAKDLAPNELGKIQQLIAALEASTDI